MAFHLRSTSIRTRLLLAYVGILLIGFAIITFVAGGQIVSAARADYEQRLLNEIRLIAQGVDYYLGDNSIDIATDTGFSELVDQYEAQVNGRLTVMNLADYGNNGSRSPAYGSLPPALHDMPEIETALRGGLTIMQRQDADGHEWLYTAAPVILSNRTPPILVQLGVPVDNLHTLIFQRWAALWGIFAVVTGVAVTATLLISRTIIQPLSALRESALRLTQGDFSHRVAHSGSDEIAEVARAFNDMAQQVESLLEEQRAFASNTSHELRTPLTTIRLRSEALRYDDKLDEESARQYIREIDDEVSRLGSLIEDLTLLSRFDAGRAELGNNQIDLGRFAFGLQQQTLDQANARNIELELAPPPEMPPVCAGLNHLTVVFRNLLDNAIKYTPDGGQVSWRLWADDSGIYSTLQDNGTGIAPEHLPHLFERFFRADKARSRDVPGTGLGLALVKSILDAYGGTITITSDGIGRGTCVTVHWPYRPKERPV